MAADLVLICCGNPEIYGCGPLVSARESTLVNQKFRESFNDAL